MNPAFLQQNFMRSSSGQHTYLLFLSLSHPSQSLLIPETHYLTICTASEPTYPQDSGLVVHSIHTTKPLVFARYPAMLGSQAMPWHAMLPCPHPINSDFHTHQPLTIILISKPSSLPAGNVSGLTLPLINYIL